MIKYASQFPEPRLRVRKLEETYIVNRTIRRATEKGEWYVDCDHGGSVCNSYGYWAETECATVVSDPDGNAVVWLSRAYANKTTDRAIMLACGFLHSSDIMDGRVKDNKRLSRAWKMLKEEHAKYWTPMEKLISGI